MESFVDRVGIILNIPNKHNVGSPARRVIPNVNLNAKRVPKEKAMKKAKSKERVQQSISMTPIDYEASHKSMKEEPDPVAGDKNNPGKLDKSARLLDKKDKRKTLEKSPKKKSPPKKASKKSKNSPKNVHSTVPFQPMRVDSNVFDEADGMGKAASEGNLSQGNKMSKKSEKKPKSLKRQKSDDTILKKETKKEEKKRKKGGKKKDALTPFKKKTKKKNATGTVEEDDGKGRKSGWGVADINCSNSELKAEEWRYLSTKHADKPEEYMDNLRAEKLSYFCERPTILDQEFPEWDEYRLNSSWYYQAVQRAFCEFFSEHKVCLCTAFCHKPMIPLKFKAPNTISPRAFDEELFRRCEATKCS